MKALFQQSAFARSCATAGFTIVESVVALGIAGFSLAAVMMVNSQQLRLVKSTRETNAASLCLEDRIEQLRIISNWNDLTSESYLRDNFFSTLLKSATPLGAYTETITVKAYLPEDTCTPLVVQKPKGREAQVISDGAGLSSLRLAEVDLEVRWQSTDGRLRTRQYATVISNTGVSRFNLPAQGSAAGLPAMGSEDQLPAVTPPPTDPTSPPSIEPVPLPNPGPGNGNGNGNPTGNVGGKSGKK